MAAKAPVQDVKIRGDYRLLLTRVLDSGEEIVERVYRPSEIDTEYVANEGWTITGTGCVLSLPGDEE